MKIYDEITNEELTSPDLSAGYLYTARRVAEHVPESREVMQGTVTEDDPKGLEHIISGYDVYEDCQLYHRYTVAELAERQQAEIEASTIVLDDATKLSLMLAEIPTEAKPTMPPKLGYKWVPTYSGTAGFVWELQEDPNAYGTNDRPLYWVDGMTVCTGYYYTDGDKLYMALQDGAPITGTNTKDVDSTDATVAVAEMLKGKTAYARGAKLTGTMPNNGAVAGKITQKDGKYTIPMGFHDGSGSAEIDETEQAKLVPANIREGVTILGVEGSMSSSEGMKPQAKSVTPTFEQQTVLPDSAYNCLSQVTVAAIPTNYVDNAAGGQTLTVGG